MHYNLLKMSSIESNSNILIKASQQPKLPSELIVIAAKLMVDGVATTKFFNSYIDNHGKETEVHASLKILVINLLKYLENEEAKEGGAKPELHTDEEQIKMMSSQIMGSLSEILAAVATYVTEPVTITQTITAADGTEETRTKKIPLPFAKLGWTVTEIKTNFGEMGFAHAKIIIQLSPMEDREQFSKPKETSTSSFKPKEAASGGGSARYCKYWQATGKCKYGDDCINKVAHVSGKSSDGFTPVKHRGSSEGKPSAKPGAKTSSNHDKGKSDCYNYLNLDEDEGGCKFGGKCHFLHDEEWAMPQSKIAHGKGKRLCKNFRNPTMCKYGKSCHHYHPTAASLKSLKNDEVAEEAVEETDEESDEEADEESDEEAAEESDEEAVEKPKVHAGAGAATKATKAVVATYAEKAKPKLVGASAFKAGKAGKVGKEFK